MLSAVHLPPVHPAVPSFRRLNWRQDDIFAKKKSAYIFDKSGKNNIKIKKILNTTAITLHLGPKLEHIHLNLWCMHLDMATLHRPGLHLHLQLLILILSFRLITKIHALLLLLLRQPPMHLPQLHIPLLQSQMHHLQPPSQFSIIVLWVLHQATD